MPAGHVTSSKSCDWLQAVMNRLHSVLQEAGRTQTLAHMFASDKNCSCSVRSLFPVQFQGDWQLSCVGVPPLCLPSPFLPSLLSVSFPVLYMWLLWNLLQMFSILVQSPFWFRIAAPEQGSRRKRSLQWGGRGREGQGKRAAGRQCEGPV